jgi:DNA-binding NarL/FixJ family response regulator
MRRQSLVCLLRNQPEFEVIGECSEGFELMELPGDLGNGIVLIDINLPSISNLDPIILIHQRNPDQRVLVLSDSLSPLPAIRALKNGAQGYVVRMDDSDLLFQAIISVHRGRRYVSELVTNQILDSLVAGKNFDDDDEERISPREKEILYLIAQGKSNSEIGKLLVISTRTVETHRNNIMRKLGLSSQIDIIRYAYKHGLLSVD